MLLESYKNLSQGIVSIYSIKGNTKELLMRDKNAIVPNSNRVIAHVLSQQVGVAMDQISVYDGLTLKATGTVSYTVNAPNGGPYEATFEAMFNQSSFSGNYDNLKMGSSAVGTFSEFTLPSSVTKSSLEQILIQWTIIFN